MRSILETSRPERGEERGERGRKGRVEK